MTLSRLLPSKTSTAFTLIELLVVITIIAILAGVALPVFQKAMEKSREAQCGSNMRQIGIGLTAYAADRDGDFPAASPDAGSGEIWTKELDPYIAKRSSGTTAQENIVFVCPSAKYDGFVGKDISRTYAGTGCLLGSSSAGGSGGGTAKVARSSDTIINPSGSPLVVEGKQSGKTSSCTSNYKFSDVQGDLSGKDAKSTSKLDFRHSSSRMNVLYADTSVRALKFGDAKKITLERWNGLEDK